MHISKSFLLLTALIVGGSKLTQAAVKASAADTVIIKSEETITKGKLTLVFKSNYAGFSPVTRQRLIDAYFKVYPEEIKRFNHQSATKVVFSIDTAYKGVAATSDAYVRFNPDWFVKHPDDIDVVTHEVMHIVQAYGGNEVPGWLTEGIADYVRFKFGVDNEKAGWKLPDYKPTQNYINAYRVTARFLVWVEMKNNKTVVDKMDAAMRAGKYTPELWKQLTGKTVDELWKEYGQNPTI